MSVKDLPTGRKVTKSGKQGAWIFATKVKLVAVIEQWNEDKSMFKLRILEYGHSGEAPIYNGEKLNKGATIWDNPYNWDVY